MGQLAVHGGLPIRGNKPWPPWPETDRDTEAAVLGALRSGRWAISWPSLGAPALERQFAQRFAEYCDSRFCVPVDHGSSALTVALQALGVGPGDEVVAPVQTWVASASAVLRLGALPVLVDVDPETGCLTSQAVRDALSERTRAIIVVHLGSTIADLDGLVDAAASGGVPLIEDCAQAHGARLRGRAVGSWGTVGAFSFQNGKVLASGEGGAVVMADPALYHTAQQLRADSRAYRSDRPTPAGEMEIVEIGEAMGVNYCLSEIQAAILLDQLPRLDGQHERRERFAGKLEPGLASLGDFGPVPVPAGTDRRSIYEYGIRFRPGTFGDAPVDRVAEALEAELGRAVYPPDVPLYRSPLFRPETTPRYRQVWRDVARKRAIGRDYPSAESFRSTTLLIHHSALLGDDEDVADVLAALEKVRDRAEEL